VFPVGWSFVTTSTSPWPEAEGRAQAGDPGAQHEEVDVDEVIRHQRSHADQRIDSISANLLLRRSGR
jgi:hypothetical protein